MPLKDFTADTGSVPGIVPRMQPTPAFGVDRAGRVLDGIYADMQDRYDAEAFTKAQVEYVRGVKDLQARYAEDADYETAPERFRDDLGALRENILDGVNGRVGERVSQWAELRGVEAEAKFEGANRQRYHAHKRAEFAREEDVLLNDIIYASSPDERDDAAQRAEMRFMAMQPFYDTQEHYENARNNFEDRVVEGMERERLRAMDGEGWQPNPHISPERNRELQDYALALQAEKVRSMERAEADAAKALEAAQDDYELDVLERMAQGGYSLDDWARDKDAGRLSHSGARRLYKQLAGGGERDTSPTTYIELDELVDGYQDGGVPFDEARAAITGAFDRGEIDQGEYVRLKNQLRGASDDQFSQAKGLLSKVYYQSPFDHARERPARHAQALQKVQDVFNRDGGAAALSFARDVAAKEMNALPRPPGYEGPMERAGLEEYRRELMERKAALAQDDSYEAKSRAADIQGRIAAVEETMRRLEELRSATQ